MDEIKILIQKNAENYDFELVNNLLIKFKQELEFCVKIDYNILNFFKDKRNFRIKADLVNFSNNKLSHEVKKSTRADIEEELTKVAASKNLILEMLNNFLGNQISKPPKIIPKKKAQSTVKSKKIKLEDQTSRWLSLNNEELKKELNDMEKYPDSKSLKQASYSILKTEERRLRKREKIINIVIKRISEERAIVRLGR
ncbi:MAG: hypothetical protein ACFFCI_14625 [Promethearchaeota archaeon]